MTTVEEVLVSFLIQTHAHPEATVAAFLSKDLGTTEKAKRAWKVASVGTGLCRSIPQAEAAFAAANVGNLKAWRAAFAE